MSRAWIAAAVINVSTVDSIPRPARRTVVAPEPEPSVFKIVTHVGSEARIVDATVVHVTASTRQRTKHQQRRLFVLSERPFSNGRRACPVIVSPLGARVTVGVTEYGIICAR